MLNFSYSFISEFHVYQAYTWNAILLISHFLSINLPERKLKCLKNQKPLSNILLSFFKADLLFSFICFFKKQIIQGKQGVIWFQHC